MKKLISAIAILAFVCLYPHGKAQEKLATFAQFSETNLHTVATNIVSTNIYFIRATLIGLRAEGQSNSAAIYVGASTNAQPYIIYPGERHVIEPAPNTKANLKDWWFKTSANDGITVIYQ